MQPTSAPFVTAADALHQISSRSQGERRRHASAGALVLGVVEQALSNNGDLHSFSLARADREVEALAPSADRSILRRMLLAVTGDPVSLPQLAAELLRYASKLESTQRIAEADAALALARAVVPRDSAAALHAGRVARKLGERARALELYRAARTLDGEDGGIARFAEIGEAVVSDDAERELGSAIRRAVGAGEAEAAAVALEERARVRTARGDRRGAARDLCLAALRYPDATDRARSAHALADLGIAAGDPLAAREALRVALASGDAPQRDHARSRLHTLSRDLGDQVGARRWRSAKRPPLVSLSLYRTAPSGASEAPRLARWRERLEASASATAV